MFRAIMWKMDLLVGEKMAGGLAKKDAVKAAAVAMVETYKTKDKTKLYQLCNKERKAALAAGGGGDMDEDEEE